MNILIVADGRSPITRRWVSTVRTLGHALTLVSTFPCAPLEGVDAIHVLPVAFSGLAGSQSGRGAANPTIANQGSRKTVARFRSLFLAGRYVFGPLTLSFYGPQFRKLVETLKPDLVHAMRIPFEGMLAASCPQSVPLAVSIWGNDLTLHAHGSSVMNRLSRRVLRRADGLAADTSRDIRLGRGMGFREDKPALVVPGSGGLDLVEIERIRYNRSVPLTDMLPAGVPLVVNPRGFRPGSVRNDVFFAAIPLVLERQPRVAFICPAMAGQPEALRSVNPALLNRQVYLLPHLPQHHLWDLFVRSTMMVSISQHDGTPNSLLEAMSCGCFPVAGDIESIREWITPGVNGLLVEPTKPAGVAEAILQALDNVTLRKTAANLNFQIIRDRAEVGVVREKIAAFYGQLKP